MSRVWSNELQMIEGIIIVLGVWTALALGLLAEIYENNRHNRLPKKKH